MVNSGSPLSLPNCDLAESMGADMPAKAFSPAWSTPVHCILALMQWVIHAKASQFSDGKRPVTSEELPVAMRPGWVPHFTGWQMRGAQRMLGTTMPFSGSCCVQVGTEGCLRLPSNFFPEGVLNPIPRNTYSFGGFPSLSDKGSSGFMGLNALRNPSGAPCHGRSHCCTALPSHSRQVYASSKPLGCRCAPFLQQYQARAHKQGFQRVTAGFRANRPARFRLQDKPQVRHKFNILEILPN